MIIHATLRAVLRTRTPNATPAQPRQASTDSMQGRDAARTGPEPLPAPRPTPSPNPPPVPLPNPPPRPPLPLPGPDGDARSGTEEARSGVTQPTA